VNPFSKQKIKLTYNRNTLYTFSYLKLKLLLSYTAGHTHFYNTRCIINVNNEINKWSK